MSLCDNDACLVHCVLFTRLHTACRSVEQTGQAVGWLPAKQDPRLCITNRTQRQTRRSDLASDATADTRRHSRKHWGGLHERHLQPKEAGVGIVLPFHQLTTLSMALSVIGIFLHFHQLTWPSTNTIYLHILPPPPSPIMQHLQHIPWSIQGSINDSDSQYCKVYNVFQ